MNLPAYIIDVIQNCLVKVLDPERIIIFGSYARGEESESSDVYICTITGTKEQVIRETAVRCRLALRAAFWRDGPQFDLLLISSIQFADEKEKLSSIYFTIANEGQTIYTCKHSHAAQ